MARNSAARLLDHMRHPLNRTGYALTISSTVASGIGFAYWLLAARLYPTEVVGRNAAAIAAMSMLAGLATFFLDGTLVRFIPRAGPSTARFVGVAYLITATTATIISVGFLVVTHFFFSALGFLTKTGWSSLAFVLFTASWCIFVEQDSVLAGLRRAVWIPLENAVFSLLKIIFLVLFSSELQAYGILASWNVPSILLVPLVNYFIFRQFIPQHIERTKEIHAPMERSTVVRYATGNYVGYVFFTAYLSLPPILVLHQKGSVASAYFYPPWVIAGVVGLVATNMAVAMIVEGAVDERARREYFRHALLNVTRLVVPVVLILLIGSGLVLRLFGTGYSSRGTMLLRLLALASIPQILVVLKIGVYRIERRVWPVILIHASIATVTLVLTVVLLPHYGIWSVGLAVLCAQTAAAVCLLAGDLRRGHTAGFRSGDEAVEP